MFSAMLFAQDPEGSKTIERMALESGEVCIYRTINAFPSAYEMTRLMNTFRPDLVFVELDRLEGALVVAGATRQLSPQTAVIGYVGDAAEADLKKAFQAGVLEVLPSPLTVEGLLHATEEAMLKARPDVQDNLLAFLPAKAGSGTSTVAVHTAGFLTKGSSRKVLVVDADLHSGLISILLKVDAQYSLLNALENAALLDDSLWNLIVARAHDLDLLLTLRPYRPAMVSWGQYHQLLQFACGRYDSVVADLPEVVNDATVEIVRRAKHVFIVTTPELPALVLARERCAILRSRGISPDRIKIVVNRWKSNEIQSSEVERFVEAPVAMVFQNDYQSVRRAIQEGRLIRGKSELGRAFTAFAQRLMAADQLKPPRATLGSLAAPMGPIPAGPH